MEGERRQIQIPSQRPRPPTMVGGLPGLPPDPHRRLSHWPRRLLIAPNIVVTVCLVATGTVYGYVRWRESQLKKVKLPGLKVATGGPAAPINILLVGNNTRTGLDPAEAAQLGSGKQVAGARSDVTMILHLDPAKNSASLLSIPRDLFVPLPPNSIAGRYGKIDAALNGTNGSRGGAD